MKLFYKALSTILVVLISSSVCITCFASDDVVSENLDVQEDNIEISDGFSNNYYCNKMVYTMETINEYEEIHNRQIESIDEELKRGGTLYKAVNYEYYISEKYDEFGNILDSHILTNQEIIEQKTNDILNNQKNNNVINAKSSTGLLGSDFEEKGKLQIGIVVIKNAYGKYHIISNAEWDTNSKIGGKNYPDAAGDDFFAVTWGGNGELKGTVTSAVGYYQSQNKMKISKAKSDSYKGYCWQFLEKNGGIGSCMKGIYTELDLNKTYTKKRNKKTNVKCTYIHTYSKVNGTISFTGGSNGAAFGVTLNKTDSQWRIQCDVPNLNY